MQDFTSWINLGTLVGASAMVLLIVQYIKAPLDKIWKIPTRFLVYVLSLFVLLASMFFTDGFTIEGAGLAALNAVVVAFAAMGAYEASFAKAKSVPAEEYAGEDK